MKIKSIILLLVLSFGLKTSCYLGASVVNKLRRNAEARAYLLGSFYGLVSNDKIFQDKNKQALLVNLTRIAIWTNIIYSTKRNIPLKDALIDTFHTGMVTYGGYVISNYLNQEDRIIF